MIEFKHRKRVLAVYVALLAMVTATLVSLGIAPASAHVGDIHVTNATCVSGDSMQATYTVGWTNGTSKGKLYQRSGLFGQDGDAGSSTDGWTFVKDVSGANGSTTFTQTHAKSTFSGGNGPWWSSKVIFSDGYGVAADTRVEGFDWNKCVPTQPPTTYRYVPGRSESCDYGVKTWNDKYTTTYSWNGTKWVGTETGPVRVDEKTTPYTDAEYQAKCAPAQPPAKVTYTDWNGDFDCNDTTVEETRTKSTTPFVWDAQTKKWVPGTTTTTTETRVRDLTDDEKTVCPVPVDVPAKPAVVDACGPNNAAFVEMDDTETLNWMLNEDGSLTVTPIAPAVFNGEAQSVTFAAPVDSNEPCPVVISEPPTPTPTPTPTPVPPVVAPAPVVPVVLGTSATVKIKPKVGLDTRCTGTTTFELDNNRSNVAVPFKLKAKHHGKVIWTKTIRVGADQERAFTKRLPKGSKAIVTAAGARDAVKLSTALCAPVPTQAPSTGR